MKTLLIPLSAANVHIALADESPVVRQKNIGGPLSPQYQDHHHLAEICSSTAWLLRRRADGCFILYS